MVEFKGFIGSAYETRSVRHGCERLVNLLVEPNTSTGEPALYAIPGLRRVGYLTPGPVRALYTTTGGRILAVSGPQVYEVAQGFTATLLGSLMTSDGPVVLTDNGPQVVLADGVQAQVLTLETGTLTPIVQEGFVQPTHVGFLDGYIVANRPGSGQFAWSAVQDARTWPVQFATAEARADPLLALIVNNRELGLFGSQTTEWWFSTGEADTPFARVSSGVFEQGIVAPYSLQALGNSVLWVSGNARGEGQVVVSEGLRSQKVSTFALDQALQTYTGLPQMTAFTYQQAGHAFYVLTSRTDGQTWAWDASTTLWHERATLQPDGTLGPYRAATHCLAFGQHLLGSATDGRLYVLDPQSCRDDEVELIRVRRAPHLRADGQRLTYQRFELLLDAGQGLDGGVGPGSDPHVVLRWSDDGGQTWSSQYAASCGRLGAYQARAVWWRLGQARERVFEVWQSDPTFTCWRGASLELQPGRR